MQGNDGSHGESSEKVYINHDNINVCISVHYDLQAFKEGSSCSMNSPSKVPKMYVNHE